MKYAVRAASAVAMLVGVYVLAVAVVAAFVVALHELLEHAVTGALTVKVAVVAALAALAMGRGLRAGLRRPEYDEPGIALTEFEHPRLWQEVRHLAGQVGTRAPDEVRLVPQVSAAVSEASACLGLVAGTRRMYVGAPLLVALTKRQLRAVLAHELGHYSGRHTTLAGVSYRGQESLRRVIHQLGRHPLLRRLFSSYARLYLAVAGSVNRRQEIEADAFSARLAGKAAAIAALREQAPIGAAWSFFLENYVGMGLPAGRRPLDVFEGFGRLWSSPERQRQLDHLRTDPAVPPRSRYDTHPSLAERVAALARLDASDGHDESGPAVGLLHDASATLRRLEDVLYDGSDLVAGTWEEVAKEGLARRTRDNAGALVAAMAKAGETRSDLGHAVESLRRGLSTDLVAPLVSADTGADRRRALAGRLVGDLVADALIAGGAAGYRLSWSHAPELVGEEGEVLDPWRPADEAARDAGHVAALEAWCEHHHVPMSHRTEPLAASAIPRAQPPAEPEVQAAAFCATAGRSRFLLVLTGGLAIRRCTFMDYVRIGIGGFALNDHGTWALRALVRRTSARLSAGRGVPFLAWNDIASVAVSRTGRRTTVVTCRMADGTTRQVRAADRYLRVHGDVWARLGRQLGDRFTVHARQAAPRQSVAPGA